ncbi:MAG: ACT domain-containing protein [Phycisphaerales bacterium]|nr:MAG: ACT domain-containing protein [Phycisphaerales bacterium]
MLTFNQLPFRLAVCRLDPTEEVPSWATGGEFLSITRTVSELSIVCPESQVPLDCQAERDWCCLRIEGPLPLDAVGILFSISALLAAEGISIFVVSTYDTDYILVHEPDVSRAIAALQGNGHRVRIHGATGSDGRRAGEG